MLSNVHQSPYNTDSRGLHTCSNYNFKQTLFSIRQIAIYVVCTVTRKIFGINRNYIEYTLLKLSWSNSNHFNIQCPNCASVARLKYDPIEYFALELVFPLHKKFSHSPRLY